MRCGYTKVLPFMPAHTLPRVVWCFGFLSCSTIPNTRAYRLPKSARLTVLQLAEKLPLT